MAIAITLLGFNDLGRSVTPFSFDGSFSLSIFYILWKNEENLLSRSFNFLQNAPSNSDHLTSSFSCAAVSNASLWVKVCENDGNVLKLLTPQIHIYNSLLSACLLQIVCLCWLTFWYFNLETLETMLNYTHQFIKIRLVFHTPYLWNEVGDPQLLFHFWNK